MRLPEALGKHRAEYLAAAAVALLLCVFFIREMFYISYSSPTFDEAYYTAYGYSLLKTGAWRLASDKGDLVPLLTGLPLLAVHAGFNDKDEHWLKLEKGGDYGDVWLYSLNFLHNNRVRADKLLFYARLPVIFLAMLLGLGVYVWSSRLYGKAGGLLSLFLYTTCPNILAHGGLATEDMALTVFAFLALYCYGRYNRRKTAADLLLAGAALGLALNTKPTAILLLPALAGCCLMEQYASGEAGAGFRRRCLALGSVGAAAVLVLLAFYGVIHIDHYLAGFKKMLVHVGGGQMSFMNGKYSPGGFWDYFIYAMLVKTPLPVLIFAVLAAAAKFKERRLPGIDAVYLTLFPALLFLAASFSGFHIGLRHILPVYPFLFVLCGGALRFLRGRTAVLVPAALLVWQAQASASVQPYYLTYFNELAGGPAHGDEHLLDSNLDWGQDLKQLKFYLDEEKVSDLVLSYYGSTLPNYLGRDYQDLFSSTAEKSSHVNGPAPSREYLAVSATNLHGVYYREFGADMFYWLRGREPHAVIGNNIRVYDVTSDARAHEHMANIYFLTGYPKQMERECRRALLLAPGSKMAGFILALGHVKENTPDGLALMKASLRANAGAAPAGLPDFLPAPLFRYRYALISRLAAEKFRAAKLPKEAEAMQALAKQLK